MKKFLTASLIIAVAAGCVGTKPKPVVVRQDSAKAQQLKAEQAQAEMQRDIEAGTPILTMPPAAAEPEQKPQAVMPPAKKPMKLGSLKPQTKYPIRNGYPEWFYTPVYDGYIGAIGIAPKGKSITAQKRVARMQAQKNLAKQLNVLVFSEVSVESLGVDSATVQSYREKVSTLTKEQVDQYLQGFRVMDEWIDDNTGEYYIWMVLEK